MEISIAEAHNRLSHWLKQVKKGESIRITRRGKAIGVLIDPEEYDQLQQVQAYLHMIQLSKDLQQSDLTAKDLRDISREGLTGEE